MDERSAWRNTVDWWNAWFDRNEGRITAVTVAVVAVVAVAVVIIVEATR